MISQNPVRAKPSGHAPVCGATKDTMMQRQMTITKPENRISRRGRPTISRIDANDSKTMMDTNVGTLVAWLLYDAIPLAKLHSRSATVWIQNDRCAAAVLDWPRG